MGGEHLLRFWVGDRWMRITWTFSHQSNMYVMCAQDSFALAHQGWYASSMHGLFRTMSRTMRNGMPPRSSMIPAFIRVIVIRDYKAYRAVDPTRSVALNLGQGVANLTYIGRGPCWNWIGSYPTYNNGLPERLWHWLLRHLSVNSAISGITDSLWYVAKGMGQSVRVVARNEQTHVMWIETTKISSTSAGKPSPSQVVSEYGWRSYMAQRESVISRTRGNPTIHFGRGAIGYPDGREIDGAQ